MTHETYWLISDRDGSSTPLGRDSVPLVYISRSGSSSATTTSGSSAGPALHQSCTSSQFAAAPPIRPRIPSDAPAVAIAFSAVAISASSATMPDAPEWPRMNAISSAFSMKLIGTSTTPSFAVANTSTTKDQELRPSRASRSPLRSPRAASAPAARFTAASNSPKV